MEPVESKVVVVLAAVIGKLKLTQISKAELKERQMNILKGAESCTCGCVCLGCLCGGDNYFNQVGLEDGKGEYDTYDKGSVSRARVDRGY